MASSAGKVSKRFHLPPSIVDDLKRKASEDRVSETSIVADALEAYFNPRQPDFLRLEDVVGSTLQKQSRAIRTIHTDMTVVTEMLAQFVRLYLGSNLPPPDDLRNQIAAVAPGRFDNYTKAVKSQLSKDGPYIREIMSDAD
ncbi:hypothetical protein [Nisaea sp.]